MDVQEDVLVPAAKKFQPDLVLISAGFDSRTNDLLGCFDVTDNGFIALTKIVMNIANEYCDDRLVSILEGGYNLEGNEVGASFGMAQLAKLDDNIKTRQENFNRQCAFFEKHSEFFSNPIQSGDFNTAWLAFPILINESAPFSRKEFQIYLEERNIQTRVVFTGNILRQPMCADINKRVLDEGYPNADAVMRRGVLLPLHHGLTEEMFARLHLTIEEFISKHTK